MPPPIDKPEELEKTPTITTGTEEKEFPVSGYRKQLKLPDIVVGLLISATGVILTVAAILRSDFITFSLQPSFGLPNFINNILFFNINWISGMWPVLIAFGLMLIFFGSLKALRIVLGCGLIALGSVFMILFIPFLPDRLMFPGLLIIGVMLILFGYIKLAFSLTKVVKEGEPSISGINIACSNENISETSAPDFKEQT